MTWLFIRRQERFHEQSLRFPKVSRKERTEGGIEGLMEVGRMLNSMMDKASLFCGQRNHVIHDETVEYLADTDD